MTKTKLAEVKPAITKLDLGCGARKQEGFTGVDCAAIAGVDIVFDLNKKDWTFAKSDTIEQIHVSHFIEHVDSIMDFMNECHRILKVGGTMNVIAPYYSSVRCWQDPTHKNAISEMSFLYYNKQWRIDNGLEHYPITADFDFQYGYAFDPVWQLRDEISRAFAVKHYINVVSDIQVTLVKRGQ